MFNFFNNFLWKKKKSIFIFDFLLTIKIKKIITSPYATSIYCWSIPPIHLLVPFQHTHMHSHTHTNYIHTQTHVPSHTQTHTPIYPTTFMILYSFILLLWLLMVMMIWYENTHKHINIIIYIRTLPSFHIIFCPSSILPFSSHTHPSYFYFYVKKKFVLPFLFQKKKKKKMITTNHFITGNHPPVVIIYSHSECY